MRFAIVRLAVSVIVVAFFTACSSDTDDHDTGITFTLSGEDVALSGFAFPPAASGDPAFVDGWEVKYDRLLVTVDAITLSENPDTSPGDQSQTGKVVARATGPWAVDLTKAGEAVSVSTQSRSSAFALARSTSVSIAHESSAAAPTTGRGSSDDTSVRLVHIANQNQSGGAKFDPAVRYAFGYDVVAASAGAIRVNLDASATSDYDEMIAKGYAVLYSGTATWKGGTACASSDSTYDFTKLPTTVHFRFGFKTPTSYVNCQNTDLEGQAFAGEEKQRGVQPKVDATTFVQLTLHTDHPFFDSVEHDAAEPYFDQFAALADADGNVTLDAASDVDFLAFKDKVGSPLPWRSCIASKTVKSGARQFDSGSVPFDKNGAAESSLRGYGDFVAYLQSAQGHMNADGLCAVRRQYASPR